MTKSGGKKTVRPTQRLRSEPGIGQPRVGKTSQPSLRRRRYSWGVAGRSPLSNLLLSVLDRILPPGNSTSSPRRKPKPAQASPRRLGSPPPIPPLQVRLDPFLPPSRLQATGGKPPVQKKSDPRFSRSQPGNPSPVAATTRQISKPLGKGSKAPSTRERQPRVLPRLEPRPVSPLVYGTRFLILGVGICAIAGTLLSASDPQSMNFLGLKVASTQTLPSNTLGEKNNPKHRETTEALLRENLPDPHGALTPPQPLPLEAEINDLKRKIQTLTSQTPQFQPGVFVLDLDTFNYVDVQGTTVFSAASTIKLPILLAFFQAVDGGKIRLDEKLTLAESQIAEGSGGLQYDPVGTQYTALEVATWMMTISDNTATNMILDRLGGIGLVNEQFKRWGLQQTVLRDRLPDLEGKNTTSPRELAQVMAMIHQGEVVSLKSRDRMISIMEKTQTSVLLQQGLGEDAIIAHKTGDIGKVLGDIGLIDLSNGKRYIAAVLVQRPHNDYGAADLIGQISKITYEYLKAPALNPSVTPGPRLEELPVDFPGTTARRQRQ